MSQLHSNRTVIVTGGARGLGHNIATAFLKEGANVVVTDVNDEALESCVSKFAEEHQSRVLAIKADSTNEEQITNLMKTASEKFGRVDVLINNAAVNDNLEPVGDCAQSQWDKNIFVNLTGPFVTSKCAVNQFLTQEPKSGGVILNVISAAGNHGARAGAAYTASKHGLVGLTKHTAAFYGPQGIRCLAIMPGAMMTTMAERGHETRDFHPEGLKLVGSGFAAVGSHFGWNKVDEVARTVVLLCSDGIGTINGSLVPTDNGWTCL